MGSVLFVEYPKCTTCKKARKWLEDSGGSFVDRHIVEDNPKAEELREWRSRGGHSMRRLFNTSGMKYRELKLKEKLDAGMSDEDAYELLASDGMLVKRPVLVGDDFAFFGFKEAEWAEALSIELR